MRFNKCFAGYKKQSPVHLGFNATLPAMKYKVFLILAGMGIYFSSFSQFRKYSNEFLNIGAGARGLGMGSAQMATTSDHTSGYWNPAGLAFAERFPSVGFMHAEYFAGIGKYDFLSASLPTNNEKRTIGITALRFGVDDIPNTLFLVEPDGSINYNNITTFSSADYAFIFSVAQLLRQTDESSVSFGGSAKIIYRQVGAFAKAWGFGIDAGVMIKKNSWHFGLAAKDVTTTFNAWAFSFSEEEKERLYLTKNDIPVKSTELTAPHLIIGVAKDFILNEKLNLTAALDADLTFGGKRNTVLRSNIVNADPKLGVELKYDNTIFFRVGINNFQQALSDGDITNQKKVWIYQPSVGAGFRFGNIGIDYAFTNLANQSNPLFTHVFSLRVDLYKKNAE
jgi:hypothetical protein